MVFGDRLNGERYNAPLCLILPDDWGGGVVDAHDGQAEYEGHQAEQDPREREDRGQDVALQRGHRGVAVALSFEDVVLRGCKKISEWHKRGGLKTHSVVGGTDEVQGPVEEGAEELEPDDAATGAVAHRHDD